MTNQSRENQDRGEFPEKSSTESLRQEWSLTKAEITNEESGVQELSTLYTSPRRDVTSDCNYAYSSCGKKR